MDDDDLLSTQDIIEEARRPMLVARHRDAVEEMEQSVADPFVCGDPNHPRLARLLKELEAESEQQRIASTLHALGTEEHHIGQDLQTALIEHTCLLRENLGVEIAALQLHVIGVYRHLRELVASHQGLTLDLAQLRGLPVDHLQRLPGIGSDREQPGFGSPELSTSLIWSQGLVDSTNAEGKRLSRAPGDRAWREADGDPSLPRSVEEPLHELPESQREAARTRLVQDRIRSRFYRRVFLEYFDRDTLDPEEVASHGTLLDWLLAIEETPHLFAFMQGQTSEQKAWRLRNLLAKLVQLNEIYQRVATASRHPTYAESFAGTDTRERLALLAKDRYPPIKCDAVFSATTLLCPFAGFASWIQGRVASKDFVLPPDPKR